jgi:hypothetical protein
MGPICCPETSAKDYHSTLRNTPEERRYQSSSRPNNHSRSGILTIPGDLAFPWDTKQLCLCLQEVAAFHYFVQKFCKNFSSLTYILYVHPSHPYLFHHPDNICRRLKITFHLYANINFRQTFPSTSYTTSV